jgi:hypothetical protein
VSFNNDSLWKENVNLRVVIAAGIVLFFGSLLLYISYLDILKDYSIWQNIIRDVSAFLIVTFTITLFWELWIRRAFLNEILSKIQLSAEIKLAGLTGITDTFQKGIDWESLFCKAKKIDIFLAYGRTWRNTHIENLKKLASDKEVRMRIIFPDPENEENVSELSRRFNYTPKKVKDLIEEGVKDFQEIRKISLDNGARVSIWYLSATPQFSFYRFDNTIIFALYSHSRERVPVPTFKVEEGGHLYNFIRKEFDSMITIKDYARCITNGDKK